MTVIAPVTDNQKFILYNSDSNQIINIKATL